VRCFIWAQSTQKFKGTRLSYC